MIEEFPLHEGKTVVVVDDRELKGTACRKLFELGVDLEPMRLPIGDFLCSHRLCLERKEIGDFEASVIDGRLFAQAAELSSNFPASVICVIGRQYSRLNPASARGALISLVADYRIPVLFFDSEDDFAQFVYSAAWREQQAPDREAKLRFDKKPLDEGQLRQYVVESLPGVGPKTAKALLAHFGSVENVFTAEEEELASVDGIGEKTAAELRRLISSRGKP